MLEKVQGRRSRPLGKKPKETDPYAGLNTFWSLGWLLALEWGAIVVVMGCAGLIGGSLLNRPDTGLAIGLFGGVIGGVWQIYKVCRAQF